MNTYFAAVDDDYIMKEMITSSASNISNISDEPTQLTSKDFDIAIEIFKKQGIIGEENGS